MAKTERLWSTLAGRYIDYPVVEPPRKPVSSAPSYLFTVERDDEGLITRILAEPLPALSGARTT